MPRALAELCLWLLALCLPGVVVGGLMMSFAWRHDPQGEFHEPTGGAIHWGPWLAVGFGWFLATTVIVLVVTLLWTALARRFHS